MGQSLSTPVIEKHTDSGSANGIRYAVTSMQGWRPNMEDAHCCCFQFSDDHPNWSYFAIFDGHAGSVASEYCAELLLTKIREKYKELLNKTISIEGLEEKYTGLKNDDPQSLKSLVVGIEQAFVQIDEDMQNDPRFKDDPVTCGTTALAMVITDEFLIFANCGDSRAILCRDNQVYFRTKDHKPNDPIESARIIRAGGTVLIDRINGNLAVARALGDYSFKTNKSLPPIEQCVSPEPTITVWARNYTDQFVVLACDGIWDVMQNEKVCELVLSRFKVTQDIKEITNCVVDCCLYLESRDNMTCLVVAFPDAPALDEAAVTAETEIENDIRAAITKILEKEDETMSPFKLVNRLSQDMCIFDLVHFYSRIGFIIDVLDKAIPDRDKTKDFCSPLSLQSFPESIQYLRSAFASYNSDRNFDNDIQ